MIGEAVVPALGSVAPCLGLRKEKSEEVTQQELIEEYILSMRAEAAVAAVIDRRRAICKKMERGATVERGEFIVLGNGKGLPRELLRE